MYRKFIRIISSLVLLVLTPTAIISTPPSAIADTIFPTSIEVHAGYKYTCALNNLGSVRCWGVVDMNPPEDLGEVSYLWTGQVRACAIQRKDSNLVCWGQGSNDIPLNLGPIKQVNFQGNQTTCVITVSNFLRCWGDYSPTIDLNEKSLQISVTGDSVCSLNFSHKVDCWAYNSPKSNPLSKINTPIVKVEGSSERGCAQTDNNELHCWGYTDLPKFDLTGVLNFEIGPSGTCIQLAAITCYTPTINNPLIFRDSMGEPDYWGQVSIGYLQICAVKKSMAISCKDYASYQDPRLKVPTSVSFPIIHRIQTSDRKVIVTWTKDSFFPSVQRVLKLAAGWPGYPAKTCTTYTNQCTFDGLNNGVGYFLYDETRLPLTYEIELSDHSADIHTRPNNNIPFRLLPYQIETDQTSLDTSNLLLLKINLGQWNWSTTLSYKWFKNGIEIPNETQSSLILKPDDANNKFRAEIRTNNAFSEDIKLTTPEITALAPTVPCLSNLDSSIWLGTAQQPAVMGKVEIGQKLSAKIGTWPKGSTLCSYWYSNGKALTAKNVLDYTIPSSMAGKTLQYVVVGKVGTDSPITRFSNALVVSKKEFPASHSIAISGKPSLGSELSTSAPSWAAGTKYKYQWFRDDVRIQGANTIKYKLTESDLNTSLALEVCGQKTDYISTCKTSPKLTIPLGQISPLGKVSVKASNSQVGGVVVLSSGKWPTGTSSQITWFRDGEPISDESGSTYSITNLDRGHTLSVGYKVTKLNYVDYSVTLVVGRIP